MKKTHGIKRGVCLILILLNLCFIWGNSILSGEESKAISDRVIAVLVDVLHIDYTGDGSEDEPDMNFLVRKAAHATEFLSLGFLSALLTVQQGQKIREWIPLPLLFGVLTALADETIQLYHARTSSVKDVWLDGTGFLVGVLLALLLMRLVRLIRKET